LPEEAALLDQQEINSSRDGSQAVSFPQAIFWQQNMVLFHLR